MNEFELEQEMDRETVANYLHQLADGLETGEKVTFIVGDESATINPPDTVHFRIETEMDSSWLGGDSGRSIEIELGWQADEVVMDDELVVVKQSNTLDRGRVTTSDE